MHAAAVPFRKNTRLQLPSQPHHSAYEDNGLASPGLWICLRPDQSGRRAGAPPKFEERRGRSVLFSEHRLVVLASSPLVSLIHLPANQLVIADDM